ncbi:MAG: Ca2+-binding RTX toxin-like protein [Verrucomicrobiales bacterium]|jgi:Ca2+-binding RTX toxin-like protein
MASSVGAQGPVMCGGQVATIVGTSGADVLNGTPGNDVIAALGGNDVVYGRAGNDILCGSHGNDRLYGGDGADKLYAFKGADRLEGGKGPDVLYGGPGADTMLGNNGQDKLMGGPGLDVLRGGAQRDNLRGGLHVDQLFGGTELDTCYSPGDVLEECEKGVGNVTVAGPSITERYAAEMFRLINIERASVSGVSPLTRHVDLDAYARDWAVVMSQQPLPLTSVRHHSPAFTGSNIAFRGLPDSVDWRNAFENVGYSAVGISESVRSVIDRLFYSPNGSGFMTSPGHRCNILETAATQVGVGSFVDAQGRVWVVQVFWGTYSPAPAPVSICQGVASR